MADTVQIIHLKKRQGLIRARLAGARKATSEILIFLDSHTEANVNWLPPLLGMIFLMHIILYSIVCTIYLHTIFLCCVKYNMDKM